MLPGTGLPANIGELNDVRLSGGAAAVLVEIVSITEIGSSAFNLMSVVNAREERERGVVSIGSNPDGAQDAAGAVRQDYDEDDEGPIQRYPRGMLRFELSDGTTTLNAIEYRSIPQLELGITPLGYKVSFYSSPRETKISNSTEN
jgi:RecQ-mediated genome instability protein 1